MAASNLRHQDPQGKKRGFVHKLYAMLSDPDISHLIWWSGNPNGLTFSLCPGTEFAHALSKTFKHGNVASFVRQLHMYGFHKVSDPSPGHVGSAPIVWEFRHSSGIFRRGNEADLVHIKRRPQANPQRNSQTDGNSNPSSNSDTSGMTSARSTLSGNEARNYRYLPFGPYSRANTTSQSQLPVHASDPYRQYSHMPPNSPYHGQIYYPQHYNIHHPHPEAAGYLAQMPSNNPHAPYMYHTTHPSNVTRPSHSMGTTTQELPPGYLPYYQLPSPQSSRYPPPVYVLGSPDMNNQSIERPSFVTEGVPVAYNIKNEHRLVSPTSRESDVLRSTESPEILPQNGHLSPSAASPRDTSNSPQPPVCGIEVATGIRGEPISAETEFHFRKPFAPSDSGKARIPSLLCDPLAAIGPASRAAPGIDSNGSETARYPSRSPLSIMSHPSAKGETNSSTDILQSRQFSAPNSSSGPVSGAENIRRAILNANNGKSVTDRIRSSLVEIHSQPSYSSVERTVDSIGSHSSSVFSHSSSSLSSNSSGRVSSFGSISHLAPPTSFGSVCPHDEVPASTEKSFFPLPTLSETTSRQTIENHSSPSMTMKERKEAGGHSFNSQLPKVEFLLTSSNDNEMKSDSDT